MSTANENLKQRLTEILVSTQSDPFAKVASADANLDVAAEALYETLPENEDAEETSEDVTPEMPSLFQPVEKVASIHEMTVQEMVKTAEFQAGMRNVMERRAHEVEAAIEKIAAVNFGSVRMVGKAKAGKGFGVSTKHGFTPKAAKKSKGLSLPSALKGGSAKKALKGAGIGAGIGAAVGAYNTHKANKHRAPGEKKSLIGGAVKGGAGGAVVGGGLAAADTAVRASNAAKQAERVAKVDKFKGKAKDAIKNAPETLGKAIGGAAAAPVRVGAAAAKGVKAGAEGAKNAGSGFVAGIRAGAKPVTQLAKNVKSSAKSMADKLNDVPVK